MTLVIYVTYDVCIYNIIDYRCGCVFSTPHSTQLNSYSYSYSYSYFTVILPYITMSSSPQPTASSNTLLSLFSISTWSLFNFGDRPSLCCFYKFDFTLAWNFSRTGSSLFFMSFSRPASRNEIALGPYSPPLLRAFYYVLIHI